MTTVTEPSANLVLQLVAEWLGKADGMEGPAPTGREAAFQGLGPQLNLGWDWPSSGPTPTVLLEGGGHYEWALDCCSWVQEQLNARKVPVYVEPYAGYALCIYPV
jgi:hypothetical protein